MRCTACSHKDAKGKWVTYIFMCNWVGVCVLQYCWQSGTYQNFYRYVGKVQQSKANAKLCCDVIAVGGTHFPLVTRTMSVIELCDITEQSMVEYCDITALFSVSLETNIKISLDFSRYPIWLMKCCQNVAQALMSFKLLCHQKPDIVGAAFFTASSLIRGR